jgi:hypothetical protein
MKYIATFGGYSTNDLAGTKAFYEKIGVNVSQDSMGLKLSLEGGAEVFIYEKSDHQPATFTVLNFVVDSIDTAVDELVAAGVTMERYSGMPAEPDEKGILRGKSANMGPDIAWFKDSAGNILAVLEQ